MALESIKYSDAAKTTISAVRDGVTLYIPVYAGNTDYDTIVAEKLTIAAYTPPAITWADIRSKRDGLLAETDWVVVKAQEVGEAVPAAWVTYRQALRDLPANTADPTKIVFPDAP
jgi:hypothetical protein